MCAVMEKALSPEIIALLETYARHSGMSVDDYVRSLLPSETDLGLAANGDFDSDMESFADASEPITPYDGSYSRDDIYAQHD